VSSADYAAVIASVGIDSAVIDPHRPAALTSGKTAPASS
jgi:hypothetical protein